MSVEVITRNVSGDEPAGLPPVLLQLEHESMTLRDLIAVTVTEQVNEAASRLAAKRAAETEAATEITRHYLLSGAPDDDVPDTAAAINQALRAFERNRFMVMVDGTQIDELDAVVALPTGAQVTFLRLTPLKGG